MCLSQPRAAGMPVAQVCASGRVGRNNLAEKWGFMAPQHKFLELDFQSEGGT